MTERPYIRYPQHSLKAMLEPKTIAVIGATERPSSVGRTILQNLTTPHFGGTIYPVNPNQKSILGLEAYPSVKDVPEPIDLAVIVTPAPTVLDIIRECTAVNVKGVVIISAGFKETGEAGAKLEEEILCEANKTGMRIIGPNCLGIMRPNNGLNASFAAAMANPGTVGFVSQSGALCASILDWSLRENVGFSAFISIGSMLDVGWGDLITYLGDDPRTKSIVIYMETIGNARAFLSAAREVALSKPIIVIKPGRTQAASRAAVAHTGSWTGRDEVVAAAFRRSGVLRVNTIEELFNMAEVLAKQPRPRGPRLTIVTNAGGPGVLATDALIMAGGELTPLTDKTMTDLNELLPSHWSHANPIDILGDADADRYENAIKIANNDANSDGLLVVLTPQAMTNPTATAQRLRELLERPPGYAFGKPVLVSVIGGNEVTESIRILNDANIPTFNFSDAAAKTFHYMWRYQKRLQSLYETPHTLSIRTEDFDRINVVQEMVAQIRASGRTLLTEYESKQVLAAYDIPVVETRVAYHKDEAVAIADKMGYPVVVKVNSQTIVRKSAIGGVRLDLATADEVRHAYATMERAVTAMYGAEHFTGVSVQPMLNLNSGYELTAGSSPDPQFGPVLMMGTGGTLLEFFQDRVLGLPPLTTTLARRMMERIQIYKALAGVPGREPVDLAEVERLMVLFSYLVTSQRWIRTIDLSPLFVSPQGAVVLDARMELYDQSVQEEELPQLAIRPYPTQYMQTFTSKTGKRYLIRPISPEDEPKIVAFHATLSERSVYLRYFRAFDIDRRTDHDRLSRICFIDYDREVVLVVEHHNKETDEEEIVGVGRLTRVNVENEAEYAIVVSDAFQGQGLGTELLRRLLEIGRLEGVSKVIAYMLAENRGMIAVSERLGFKFSREGELVKGVIDLKPS